LLVFFTPMRNKSKYYVYLGEPLRGLCPLASGYPLHHLRASLRASRFALRASLALRWFRYYPSRFAPFGRAIKLFLKSYYSVVRRDKSRLYTRRFIVETRFIASRVIYTKGHFARGKALPSAKRIEAEPP
jgi:hypothetical protein